MHKQKIEEDSIVYKKLSKALGHYDYEEALFRGELTYIVKKEDLFSILRFLHDDDGLRLTYLSDLSGVDYLPREPRFEIVYHLYSITHKFSLRVKVKIADGESVPSVTSIWNGADWPERECYDMFGVTFDNHPDFRRIYLADDWEGFPMRKDYPLKGYKDEYNPFGEEKK